jgi:hypothetical protein
VVDQYSNRAILGKLKYGIIRIPKDDGIHRSNLFDCMDLPFQSKIDQAYNHSSDIFLKPKGGNELAKNLWGCHLRYAS